MQPSQQRLALWFDQGGEHLTACLELSAMPQDGFFHTASPAVMQEGGLRVDLPGKAKAPERRDRAPKKDRQAADQHPSGNRYHSQNSGFPWVV